MVDWHAQKVQRRLTSWMSNLHVFSKDKDTIPDKGPSPYPDMESITITHHVGMPPSAHDNRTGWDISQTVGWTCYRATTSPNHALPGFDVGRCHIPMVWMNDNVVAIFKKGDNYRPVSLTSVGECRGTFVVSLIHKWPVGTNVFWFIRAPIHWRLCLIYRRTMQTNSKTILRRWDQSWLMKYLHKKCQILHITDKNKPLKNQYYIHGHLEERETSKYLGVDIHRKLN